MASQEKQHKAIDLHHHLSDYARADKISPLKALGKYWEAPGILSLAGGLPSPAYFPFSSISGEALVSDSFPLTTDQPSSSFSWLWSLFGTSSSTKEKTFTVTVPKYPATPGDLSLSTALQYGAAIGLPQLQKIIHDFTTKVYQPAYEDFATLIQSGNTDGWHRAVIALCNKGDCILAAEWTYPSALVQLVPLGITVADVAIDGQGIRADSLRSVLRDWDEVARGAKRPHVLYIIPVGQNPTGATMGVDRKKEIYDVCVEYDVIIVEDDPYYFLQEGPYVPKAQRINNTSVCDEASFISGLQPTFLKFDYQGRVIRLDTFSKTIAPGSRLGWFTCSPLFTERFERLGEKCVMTPCGFSQSLVTQLLMQWKYEGYIRWLKALAVQYTARRDHFIDCLREEFHLEMATAYNGPWDGCQYYLASQKRNDKSMAEKFGRTTFFSFVPPTSGMFLWVKLHFDNFPAPKGDSEDSLEVRLWKRLAEDGLLLAPGWIFSPDLITSSHSTDEQGHFRISFSNCEFDDMKKAVTTFGRILREFFEETLEV